VYRSVGPKVVLLIDQLILRWFCLYISWYYGFSLYRSVGPKVVLFIDQLSLGLFCLWISWS
jgi:hypothetical protein